jgi:hypothetical protein
MMDLKLPRSILNYAAQEILGYAAKWCSELANCRPGKGPDIFSLSETSCFKKILEVDTAMQRPEHAAMRAVYIELTK